jgi:hypothetical protein
LLGGGIEDPDQALGAGGLHRTDHQVALGVVIGQPGAVPGEGGSGAGEDFLKAAGGMVEQDAPAGLGGPSAGEDPAVGAFPFGPEGQALAAGDVEQAVDAAGAQVQAGVEGGLGPFESAVGLIEGGVGIQFGQEAALGVEGGGSGAIEGIAILELISKPGVRL